MRKILEISGLYPAPLIRLQQAPGASQTAAWFATAADGQDLFIKHDGEGSGLLEAEADGLIKLAASGALRIPKVFAASPHWLLLEAIEREPAGDEFWIALAQGLLALHQHNGLIGWHCDNFIGRHTQQNKWSKGDWAAFFWNRRLLPQIESLRRKQIWSAPEDRSLLLLERAVYRILGTVDEPASLLHGDLWSGNILCGTNQEAVLIDPAVYYGHRETDLAMTELFGGFSPLFFQHYTAGWPLAPGYPQRRLIYNFYHKLNHANLYGSGYIWDVKKTLLDICEYATGTQPPMAENVWLFP